MKSKRFTKKLVLNKRTVTDLDTRHMGVVQGGVKTGVTCLKICDTVNFSCYVTQCGTCVHSCPATWCDTECGC
ncbi:MAG: hypothetical protein GTO45_20265 [Candidatus Aminicenantes bacterium]|nr:hypothetical protein [Candidatus Aminicenantes bacterium]NIM81130.1 hypothetical protein [Candidatus Aminicenantes bacterium]NIN20504.1 hypothetical protein [Candidatus Aminicenantes bacterium]NIN44277.1 hypothetical protein [Candidatus Aminicenantes bacterium]NIN87096.1 hypothetical protein [Candidatus Aminicenantes bacterium]